MATKYQQLWRPKSWSSNDIGEWDRNIKANRSPNQNVCSEKAQRFPLQYYTINSKKSLLPIRLKQNKQSFIRWISLDDMRYSIEKQPFILSHASQQQQEKIKQTSEQLHPQKTPADYHVPIKSKLPSTQQERKTSFRSLSENNLSKIKYEAQYRSCPPLSFKETVPPSIKHHDIFDPFRSNQIAILSGSSSALVSMGLQNLIKRYTDVSLPHTNQTAWTLIEPHFFKGPPRIRFESILDIIQQYIDPNLSLLDVLMTDAPAIDQSHFILALLSMSSTVVTTDFDHLIEDAGRFHLGNDPNIVPFDVYCTEEHFKQAYHSIQNHVQSNLIGLWKLHGTVALWKNKEKVLLRADEDGGPVATLKRLSLTRESQERQSFLHYLLETRPFIIVNYSASDDFDVIRWLKSVEKPLNVLWIQHNDTSEEIMIYNGNDIGEGKVKDMNNLDRGLISMACVWYERGIGDHLTVVTTADPIKFVLEIVSLNIPSQNTHISRYESYEEYPLSSPTSWQSYIISGAMLFHLSYFSQAKSYFEHASSLSIKGTREYCIAKLALAEASIETGNRNERIQAMNDACDAAKTAPLSLKSWAKRKSQVISAIVKRFVEKNGQAIAIQELEHLLNQCKKPDEHFPGREKNVAIEAAILLAQLRRFLPTIDPQPSDITKLWIESIPKHGLLHTKALNLHESALNKYQSAKNIEELDEAIHIMKEAMEIREELGHMRGLVASLNVLGSMQMRRADWTQPFDIKYVKYAVDEFRRSILYSNKHAAVFDQYQARIHLTICLFRYPFLRNDNDDDDELTELLEYFRIHTTDDMRTEMESDFCLAMSVFLDQRLSFDEVCDRSTDLFDGISTKYASENDVRLIRIRSAARFNSELCQDWKRGQAHKPNVELTQDIITRKVGTSGNAYWLMRILRAESEIPTNTTERLQLLLDPLSP